MEPMAIGDDRGSWKSGLCSCCRFGCCHPALCCAVFFPFALMGQLLTRMKMTWLGQESSSLNEYKKTFKITVAITIVQLVAYAVLSCQPNQMVVEPDGSIEVIPNDNCTKTRYSTGVAVQVAFAIYQIYVMIKLRSNIRARHNIPEDYCPVCEDLCCVVFCGCCASVQMAHQTANYNTVSGSCCTDTGLPPGVECEVDIQSAQRANAEMI